MAEIDFDQPFDRQYDRQDAARVRVQPGALQGYINIAGAVTSLVLVIGVAVWGYKLVMRDATGIPVIKALKGPMRIAPEDPGGQIARNEGLAVNQVAADAPMPPAPTRVVLAPKPITLSTNDTAPADTAPKADATAADTTAADAATADAGAATAATATAAPTAEPAQPAPPADPVEAALQSARAAAEAVTGEGPQPVTGGTDLAVTASIRPQLRPSDLKMPAQPASAAAAPKVTEIDPATLKPGTRLVQLGAYPDADSARAAWGQIAERFGDLMQDHGMVVQKAESGGRSFYRLRAAGFDNEADARAFCAAFAAQNAGCIPVTIR